MKRAGYDVVHQCMHRASTELTRLNVIRPLAKWK